MCTDLSADKLPSVGVKMSFASKMYKAAILGIWHSVLVSTSIVKNNVSMKGVRMQPSIFILFEIVSRFTARLLVAGCAGVPL